MLDNLESIDNYCRPLTISKRTVFIYSSYFNCLITINKALASFNEILQMLVKEVEGYDGSYVNMMYSTTFMETCIAQSHLACGNRRLPTNILRSQVHIESSGHCMREILFRLEIAAYRIRNLFWLLTKVAFYIQIYNRRSTSSISTF